MLIVLQILIIQMSQYCQQQQENKHYTHFIHYFVDVAINTIVLFININNRYRKTIIHHYQTRQLKNLSF